MSFNLENHYRTYYRKAFLFAKSYVHDQQVAEDIASEALMSLWISTKQYEIHHPLTFLFSIVRNKSIDYLRHELIHQKALATMSEIGLREINMRITSLEACDPEKIYSEDIQTIVESTLKNLPERTREIFMMSRYQGLDKEEIATALGITTKGVEYHLTKALSNLRISLKDYLPFFYFLLFL